MTPFCLRSVKNFTTFLTVNWTFITIRTVHNHHTVSTVVTSSIFRCLWKKNYGIETKSLVSRRGQWIPSYSKINVNIVSLFKIKQWNGDKRPNLFSLWHVFFHMLIVSVLLDNHPHDFVPRKTFKSSASLH